MKKNLFEISSGEVQRILSLHESRTKSQYLNIIEEATGAKGSYDNPYTSDEIQTEVDEIVDTIDGFTTMSQVKDILDTLMKYQNKVAINDDNPIKPVKVTALSRLYHLYYVDEDENLDTDIKNEQNWSESKYKGQLLKFIETTKQEKLIVPKKAAQTEIKFGFDHSFGNGAFKTPKNSVAKIFKDEAGTVNQDFVEITTPDNKKVYFNCTSKTFSNGVGKYVPEDNNGTLANTLLTTSFLCNKKQLTVPPPVDGITPPPVDGITPPATDATKTDATNSQQSQTQQVNRQNQFVQRTVTAINNVQKTLGVNPTGQLKNSDIDNLLTKLQK